MENGVRSSEWNRKRVVTLKRGTSNSISMKCTSLWCSSWGNRTVCVFKCFVRGPFFGGNYPVPMDVVTWGSENAPKLLWNSHGWVWELEWSESCSIFTWCSSPWTWKKSTESSRTWHRGLTEPLNGVGVGKWRRDRREAAPKERVKVVEERERGGEAAEIDLIVLFQLRTKSNTDHL